MQMNSNQSASKQNDISQYLGPKRVYSKDKELSEFYTQMNRDCNNNNSRVIWEWMRNAPCLDDFYLDRFKLWTENGQVICAARPASPWLGEAVIDNRSTCEELLSDVITYVEANFFAEQENKKSIFLILMDSQHKMDELLKESDYTPVNVSTGTLQFNLEKELLSFGLAEGFSVHKLSEVYDFDQLSKLLWLGFDYSGEVPAIDADVKLSIKHAWLNYNQDVCSVVLDKNGIYASFCGFWYDEVTQTAFLEPMVTAKEYQNMGLGKAAVYHSLKILKKLGCKKAFVEPDEEPYPYYLKIGFEPFSYARYYQKTF